MTQNRRKEEITDPEELHQLERLKQVFMLIDGLRNELDEPDGQFPQAGSSLAGDDRKTEPYQISHLVRTHIGVAMSQLHALDDLINKAQAIHQYAAFPLIRAAIENAGTAYWLLQPLRRQERVTRRWRLAVSSSFHMKHFHDVTFEDIDEPSSHADRLERYRQLAADHGITEKLTPIGNGKIMREVDAHTDSGMSIEALWQLCSGISHGQQWAILSVLDHEFYERTAPGVQTAWASTGVRQVLWGVGCAWALLRSTCELYGSRGRSQY